MAKPATKPKVVALPADAKSPANPPGSGSNSVNAETLKQFYRDMLLIRRFEERAGQLYGMGLIGGFCHLYIGQEAVVVGMQSTINDKDAIITSYRDHGHMLAAGMEARGVMAELTGKPAPEFEPQSARYELEMSFSRGLFTGWFRGIDNRELVHARFGTKRGVFLGPIEKVDAESVSLPIPAQAELVIEGTVREGDVMPEGPLTRA